METLETAHGAILVLKPIGPLVEADAAAFRTQALDAASRSLGRMVLDASAVPFLDSSGVEALLDITEKLGEGGRSLKMCSTTNTVRDVLELTGWISAFELCADVPMAVREFL